MIDSQQKNWDLITIHCPLFLAALLIYQSTLNPSLFRNDSPETITACWTLGVCHAPGYPLHTLLGRMFSFLPIGNPALVLNFFSAVLASLAVCLFAANVQLFLPRGPFLKAGPSTTPLGRIVVITSGLIFTLSNNFWSCALAAKGGIYTLQALLELSLLLWIQKSFQYRNFEQGSLLPKEIFGITFLFSLGLANHWPTQALLIPAGLLLALGAPRLLRSVSLLLTPRILLFATSIMTAGLSLYLYLPLRSNLHPALNFGAPCTFDRFLSTVLREHYTKSEALLLNPQGLFPFLQRKLSHLSDHLLLETYPMALALAALGIWSLLQSGNKLRLMALLSLTATTLVANWVYLKVDPIDYWHISDHLLTVNWTMGLLTACGLFKVLTWARGRPNKLFHTRTRLACLAGILLLLPFATYSQNIKFNMQSQQFLYHGYGVATLRSMEKGSFYFAEQDYDFFSVLYLREVLQRRPDLAYVNSNLLAFSYEFDLLVSKFPAFFPQNASSYDLNRPFQTLTEALKNKAIYCAYPDGSLVTAMMKEKDRIAFRPEGILTRLDPLSRAADPIKQLQFLDAFWDRYLKFEKDNQNPIGKLLVQLCSFPYVNTAEYFRMQGNTRYWDPLHERALSLASEWQTIATVWERKAHGNEVAGNKKTAIADYWMAARYFELNRQTDHSRAALERAGVLAKEIGSVPANP